MSQFNSTNYPTVTPVADDLLLIRQDSSGDVKTATIQGTADAMAALASQNVSVSVVSTGITLTTQQMVVGNSGSAFDITLPPSSTNTGKTYLISNKGTADVTVVCNGSDTIFGASSITLNQYETATLRSDGLGMWHNFVI